MKGWNQTFATAPNLSFVKVCHELFILREEQVTFILTLTSTFNKFQDCLYQNGTNVKYSMMLQRIYNES